VFASLFCQFILYQVHWPTFCDFMHAFKYVVINNVLEVRTGYKQMVRLCVCVFSHLCGHLCVPVSLGVCHEEETKRVNKQTLIE
jgi:hypothetical protein